MVIVSVDVETYEYDEKTKKYKPSLNADFSLGCVMIDKKKKPLFFYDPEEMWNYLLDLIERKKKEGHNVYIFAHNHGFDLAKYGKQHLQDTDKLKIIQQKPLIARVSNNLEDKQGGWLLDTMSFLQSENSRALSKVGEMLYYL